MRVRARSSSTALPLFPGGGGQLPDRGRLSWEKGEAAVTGFAAEDGGLWHLLDTQGTPGGIAAVTVDADFRNLMCRLHTVAHIANAAGYQAFDGALLTGASLAADGTLRVDFDLPGTANAEVRALAGPINDAIAQDLEVATSYMAWDDANAIPGMFRSKAVSPPKLDDGSVRIVEIAGLDRQACGGTHLSRTGEAGSVEVLKVENKGRHNRRLRLGLVDRA